jgi:ABC-type amino acid transport substrate-binding protein
MKILTQVLLAMALVFSLALAGCTAATGGSSGAGSADSGTIASVDDLDGLVMAFQQPAQEMTPEIVNSIMGITPGDIVIVPTFNEALAAVKSGRADFTASLKVVVDYMAASDSTLASLPGANNSYNVTMIALEENTELLGKLNTAIEDLKANGTMDDLVATYITGANAGTIDSLPRIMPLATATQTITVGVCGDLPPVDYVSASGEPSGFNVALMTEIANACGYKVEFEVVPFESKFSAITSGRIDVFFSHMGMQSATGIASTEAYLTDVPGAVLIRK